MNSHESKSNAIRTVWTGFAIIALSILFFFVIFRSDILFKGLGAFLSIMRPFLIGAVIAYLLLPICRQAEIWLDRILPKKIKHLAHSLAVFCAIFIGILIIYLLLSLILPDLVASLQKVARNVPRYFDKGLAFVESHAGNDEVILGYIEQFSETASNMLTDWLNNKLLPSMQSVITNLGAGVFGLVSIVKDIVIGIIVAIYLLLGRKRFAAQSMLLLYGIFKPKAADAIHKEVRYANKVFEGFLIGKIIDSTIIAIICYIFCLLAKIPNALLCSVIIGVTNIIPFFGPFIGLVPTLFLILMVSPFKALVFLIFICVLQQVDGNIIGPKILGDSTGLSSFWVLFAILLFGGLFGFVGMVIGVPLFAVIYDIIKKIIYSRIKHHGKIAMLEKYDDTYHKPGPNEKES